MIEIAEGKDRGMESLTGNSKANNTEDNAVSSFSLFSDCNVITEDNTDTPVDQLTFNTDVHVDEESDALKIKVDVLERKVEEAEQIIKTLTKEKSEANKKNKRKMETSVETNNSNIRIYFH